MVFGVASEWAESAAWVEFLARKRRLTPQLFADIHSQLDLVEPVSRVDRFTMPKCINALRERYMCLLNHFPLNVLDDEDAEQSNGARAKEQKVKSTGAA